MFYTVTIVDTTVQHDNTCAHKLIEYQVEDLTGASARTKALEHHLARTDRGPTAAVRWAIVGRAALELKKIVQISERSLDLAELRKLEEINRPYVVA